MARAIAGARVAELGCLAVYVGVAITDPVCGDLDSGGMGETCGVVGLSVTATHRIELIGTHRRAIHTCTRVTRARCTVVAILAVEAVFVVGAGAFAFKSDTHTGGRSQAGV
jgi:hypothetical protein